MVHLIIMQMNFTVSVMNAELENMIHLISMQMNFTVCVMNAEYVEYGTFDKYADELYNIFNECRVCRIWYIISIQMKCTVHVKCCTYYLYTIGILHIYLVDYKPFILQKKIIIDTFFFFR